MTTSDEGGRARVLDDVLGISPAHRADDPDRASVPPPRRGDDDQASQPDPGPDVGDERAEPDGPGPLAPGERLELPEGHETNTHAVWVLEAAVEGGYEDERQTEWVRVDATFLGVGSSRTDRHAGHAREDVLEAGSHVRCNRCRWFETRIFRVGPDDYVVHNVGRSIITGEVDLPRIENFYSPADVIEGYTVRKVNDQGIRDAFITKPAARALAQAVRFDPPLAQAAGLARVR